MKPKDIKLHVSMNVGMATTKEDLTKEVMDAIKKTLFSITQSPSRRGRSKCYERKNLSIVKKME